MSPRQPSTPIEVLLVEDNPDDARLTMQVLERAKIRNRVQLAVDGEDALEYLKRRGRHAGAQAPDLILLDLNLPKLDGRALLEEIKRDETLRQIPVVIVTGSSSEEDALLSYQLHANAYVTKPLSPVDFLKAVNAIERFWLEIVRLP